MADEVSGTAIHSFEDPSHIGGQIVHSYAVERAATLSSTAHVNGDGLQPSGSEHARQVVKITGAAAGIREQHDRGAGPAKGAFERRAADFEADSVRHDVTPLDFLESLKASTKQRECAQPVGSRLTPPVFLVPGWVNLKGDHQLLLPTWLTCK